MKILLLILISVSFAFANTGKIVALKGSAEILRENNSIKANIGSVLLEKDIIKTSSNSKLQIIFSDKTIVTLGKNSELNIEEYLFDTDAPKKSKVKFGVVKGAFKSITGKIGKLAPKKFELRTKTATIGIRGTTTMADQQGVACLSGENTVTSEGVTKVVPSGMFVRTLPGFPPSDPEVYQDGAISGMDDESPENQDSDETQNDNDSSENQDSDETQNDNDSSENQDSDDSENTDPVSEDAQSEQGDDESAGNDIEEQSDQPSGSEGESFDGSNLEEEIVEVEGVELEDTELEPIDKQMTEEGVKQIEKDAQDHVDDFIEKQELTQSSPVSISLKVNNSIVQEASEGLVVATILTFDEQPLTYVLSNTEYFKLVEDEVQLTVLGAEVLNNGDNLPDFTVTANGVVSQTIVPEIDFLNNVITSQPNLDSEGITTSSDFGNDYLDFGSWNNSIDGTSGHYIVGKVTPSQIMEGILNTPPATQTYEGQVSAIQNVNNEVSNVSGTVSLSVDFAAQTVNGNMQVNNSYWEADLAGTINKYGIVGTSVSGTANGINSISGDFKGDFYGTSAQGVGGDFNIKDDVTADTLKGVFGATTGSLESLQ